MTMKISVIGLGLIGGSIALNLCDRYCVNGVDCNHDTINYINQNGWFYASSNTSIIKDSDVIILALYPKLIKKWIEDHQEYIKKDAIIIDTSGIKERIFEDVLDILRSDIYFVGAHPMAGKEKSGIQFANKNLFESANLIIVENKTDKRISKVEELAKALGFKNISYLDAKQHDEMIGYLSQLTHVIAISLMNANDNPLLALYSGDSFRDLTRIAKINETLWYELFIMNKDALLKEIDCFIAEISSFRNSLANDDEDVLKEKMITSTVRRIQFDEK